MMPIRCNDISRWLYQEADGRLSEAEAALLATHLSTCTACSAQQAVLDRAFERLAHPRPLPSAFADRLMRRVAQAPSPARGVRATPARYGLWMLVPLAAGIAVLALGVTLSAWAWLKTRGPARVASVAAPTTSVELECVDVRARSAAVAGDFNRWEAAPMQKGKDGVWRIRLSLPPGRYQYAFVIDGEKWAADAHAATIVDSAYGGADSVLEVSL